MSKVKGHNEYDDGPENAETEVNESVQVIFLPQKKSPVLPVSESWD